VLASRNAARAGETKRAPMLARKKSGHSSTCRRARARPTRRRGPAARARVAQVPHPEARQQEAGGDAGRDQVHGPYVSSMGRGFPKKKPWACVKPIRMHTSASAAVSTPSATV
jgi:hypothetical protein